MRRLLLGDVCTAANRFLGGIPATLESGAARFLVRDDLSFIYAPMGALV